MWYNRGSSTHCDLCTGAILALREENVVSKVAECLKRLLGLGMLGTLTVLLIALLSQGERVLPET
jgi:hypothetical protein